MAGIVDFANSVSSYLCNVDTIVEEEEREARSRRREFRRRSTIIDGRESKLTGAIELNLAEEAHPKVTTRHTVKTGS